nr:hypothetical protein [Tanacetum cinerariifolium]
MIDLKRVRDIMQFSPYTGNYMLPRAELSFDGLDNYVFKSKISETITSVPKIETHASKTSKDSLEILKTVRPSAPLIEEWESDSKDENVFKPKKVKKTVKPSLEKIEFVNTRNIIVENENKAEKPRKFSQSPRAAVLTKSGQVPVNAAKQSSHRAAASVSTARHFWQTATTRTLDNGEMEITTTIDRKVKVVTKASVRRHLKLEDSDGISIFPTTEIFKQLALIGHGRAATTVTTLDAGHDSDRVLALEEDLKQTKKVYGAAYTKLIMKGRYEQDMEFDFDAAKEVTTTEQVFTAGVAVTTASIDIGPASPTRRLFTADDITMEETLVYIKRSATKRKDKGKGIMEDSKSAMTKTKRQQEQEKLSHKVAMRLQEEFDEEERQRITRVHEAAQSFSEEECENIRARVKADKELTQRLQAEERNNYSEVDQAKMLIDLINQRKRYFAKQKAEAKRKKPMTQAQQMTYMSNYIKHIESYTHKQLKKLSFDEIKELFKATMRSIKDFIPIKSEDDKAVPKLAEARSLKRDAEEELNQ